MSFSDTLTSGAGLMLLLVSGLWLSSGAGAAGQGTSAVLSWKGSDEMLHRVTSEQGNLFGELSNHGPAVENPWAGYRLYFRGSAGIDVLSKNEPRLVLPERGWYQFRGEGDGDVYSVGTGVGLGGLRLWDDGKAQPLEPVQRRVATMESAGAMSKIDMLSEGIPFQDRQVNVLVRLTVLEDVREALVDVFVLAGGPVPLAFGIAEAHGYKTDSGATFVANWGRHKSGDDAPQVGAAVIFPDVPVADRVMVGEQKLIVTSPVQHIQYRLSTGSSLETEQGLNTPEKFLAHARKLAATIASRRNVTFAEKDQK